MVGIRLNYLLLDLWVLFLYAPAICMVISLINVNRQYNMKKIILTTLLVFATLASYCQTLHYKVFAINRAVYSNEFQKYMFDENVSTTGDIYVTYYEGKNVIHIYTADNVHIKFNIIRELYDDYNNGDHQVGYKITDEKGFEASVKFMFRKQYVEVYFFFDTTAYVYSVRPQGRL